MITKLMSNINEEIKTLNKIMMDKNYFDELEKKIDIINKMLKEKDKEIDRLNNIINELNGYLFSLLNEYGGGGIIADIYNKLKELKEGNK